jgi:molybdopterin converting factor small subunit
LVTINFLGNCKKIMGCSSLKYEKHPASINDIVSFVSRAASSSEASAIRNDFLIVINGVDSSVLNAEEQLLQDGDLVTVVPVIHGG